MWVIPSVCQLRIRFGISPDNIGAINSYLGKLAQMYVTLERKLTFFSCFLNRQCFCEVLSVAERPSSKQNNRANELNGWNKNRTNLIG